MGAGVLAALAGLSSANAGAQPRLVVVDVSPEALPAPYEAVKLGEELGRALEGAGCRVDRTCATEDCARNASGPSPHVLSFDLRYDRKQFACSFSLEVRDAPGGRVEYREKASSPVCPAGEALEDSRRAARVACDELRKAAPGGGSRSLAAARLPRSGTDENLHTSPAPPPPPARGLSERTIGTAIVAAGAASIVGGAVLLYLNGQPTSCAESPDGERVCTRTRQTGLAAVPLLVVGAAGIGWGSWRLLGTRDGSGLLFGLAASTRTRALLLGGTF
jgi:hypothetical protein